MVLRTKLPGGVEGLETTGGILPANQHARQCFEHIITLATTTLSTHKSYRKLTMDFHSSKYIPNPQGSAAFFKYCQRLQAQIAELSIGTTITDETIIAQATTAFLESGHDTTRIKDITDKYNAKPADEQSFDAFITHWNKYLRVLWESGDHGTATKNEQANHTERIATLETQLAENKEHINDITEVLRDEAALRDNSAYLSTSKGADRVGTDVSTISNGVDDISTALVSTLKSALSSELQSTLQGIKAELQSQVSAGLANNNNNRRQPGNRPPPNQPSIPGHNCKRQYKYYCFSRGVNPICDGTRCTPVCKKHPDHKPEATFDNCMGGSDRNVHRWMKWLDKHNRFCETEPAE